MVLEYARFSNFYHQAVVAISQDRILISKLGRIRGIKVVDRMNKHYIIENYSNLRDELRSSSNYNLQALFYDVYLSRGKSVSMAL